MGRPGQGHYGIEKMRKIVFAQESVNLYNACKEAGNDWTTTDGVTYKCLSDLNTITGIKLEQYFDNGFKVGVIEKCEEVSGTHLQLQALFINSQVLKDVIWALQINLSK